MARQPVGGGSISFTCVERGEVSELGRGFPSNSTERSIEMRVWGCFVLGASLVLSAAGCGGGDGYADSAPPGTAVVAPVPPGLEGMKDLAKKNLRRGTRTPSAGARKI